LSLKIREKGGRIITVLTSYEGVEPEKRRVYVRLADMPEEEFHKILEDLRKEFNLLYWVKDDLSRIPRKGATKTAEAVEALLKI
jgi:acetoin utilization protein AcuB